MTRPKAFLTRISLLTFILGLTWFGAAAPDEPRAPRPHTDPVSPTAFDVAPATVEAFRVAARFDAVLPAAATSAPRVGIAAGEDHVIGLFGGAFVIVGRSGTQTSPPSSVAATFTDVPGCTTISGTDVLFDRTSRRFVLAAIGERRGLCLAVRDERDSLAESWTASFVPLAADPGETVESMHVAAEGGILVAGLDIAHAAAGHTRAEAWAINVSDLAGERSLARTETRVFEGARPRIFPVPERPGHSGRPVWVVVAEDSVHPSPFHIARWIDPLGRDRLEDPRTIDLRAHRAETGDLSGLHAFEPGPGARQTLVHGEALWLAEAGRCPRDGGEVSCVQWTRIDLLDPAAPPAHGRFENVGARPRRWALAIAPDSQPATLAARDPDATMIALAHDPDGQHLWALVATSHGPNRDAPAALTFFALADKGTIVHADDFESGDFSAWSDVVGADLPPVLDPIGPQSVPLGSTLTIQLTATDPESQPIRFGALPIPLPPGAHLDAVSGLFTYAPAPENVGVVTLTFTATDGVSVDAEMVDITVTGPGPSEVTALSGRLLDANDFVQGIETPIVGATVGIIDESQTVVSSADGSFTLSDIAGGVQVLDIDTATAAPAPGGAPYAAFREAISLISGVENVVTRPFFLPRIAVESLTPVDPTATTEVINPTLGVTLTVPPHTAKNPDGTDFTGELSISLVPESLAPVALPETHAPGFLLTIQPVGVTFAQPVPITVPNVDQLSPESETDIWSLDAASGTFGIVGTGRVRTDGSAIDTIVGGIVSASWHDLLPPSPDPDPRDENDENHDPALCDDCDSGSDTALSSGSLTVTHDLVPYRSNDQLRGLRLVYTSETADPRPVVSSRVTILALSSLPLRLSTRLEIGGVDQGERTFTDPAGLDGVGMDRALRGGVDGVVRLAAQGRVAELGTGLFPYRLHLTSHFLSSAISAIQTGNLLVHNRRASPIGAGWGIDALQRIQTIPGSPNVLITDGNGGIQRFEPSPNVEGTVLLDDPFDAENAGFGAGFYDDFTHWNVVDLRAEPAVVLLVGNGVQDEWPGNGLYVGMDVDPTNYVALVSKAAFTFTSGLYEVRLRVATPMAVPHPYQLSVLLQDPADPFDHQELFGVGFTTGEVSPFEEVSCLIEVTAGAAPTPLPPIVEPGLGGCFLQIAPTDGRLVLAKPAGTDEDPIGGLYVDDVRLTAAGAVSGFASPAGDTSVLRRDDSTGTYQRVEKDGSLRQFDAQGRQVAWVERTGQTTTYAYDAEDRLVEITDPAGRVTSLAYEEGHLATITDPAERVTRFFHDPGGDLLSITDPDDSARTFEYDAEHRLISQTSKRDFETTYEYNFAGQNTRVERPDRSERLIQPLASMALGDLASGIGTEANPLPFVRVDDAFAAFTDGRGNTTRFKTNRFGSVAEKIDALSKVSTTAYNEGGRATSITSPEGIVTEFLYDGRLNLVRVREAVGTPLERDSAFVYEQERNQVVRAIDPSGAEAKYDYDPSSGNLLTFTDAAEHQRIFTWDAIGRLETATDARRNVTTFRYGPYGNLEEIEDALGRITHLERDDAGNVTEIIEAFGTPDARTWSRSYDAMNRLTATTDPTEATTSFDYDDAGNVESLTQPSGLVTSATYDPEDRLSTVTTPQAGTSTFTYDENGNLETATDSQDRTTIFGYDPLDRLTTVTDPNDGVSTTVYDDDGRVESFENARGKVTSFQVDDLGRLRSRTNPNLETVTLDYDEPRDLVKTYTDAEDQVIAHTYDALGRRETTLTPDDSITFAYDPEGNLERVADNDSEILFTYDALNRIETEITTFAGSGPIVLTHSYHPAYGNRTGLADSLGGNTVFTHDPANRLASVTSAAGPQVDLDWDADGRLEEIAHPNGVTAVYSYDAVRGLLATLTFADGSGPLLSASYGYDLTGRIESITEGGQTRLFGYDELGRLASGGTTGLPESYSYDSVGNRTGSHLSASYTHDDADRLLADDTHTYTYDRNGNLRTKTETASSAVTTYSYDALNRLIGVDLPGGGTVAYSYDALGRRFEKDVDGTVTRYLHDGPGILVELDPAHAVTARYGHGALVDQPLVQSRGGTDAFYLADHQGSIRFLLDDTGATLNQYAYDSFGNPLVAIEAIANPFTYTARQHDPETNHLHYRARAYDPTVGRFQAQDPIGFAGGDANLYAYVGNDPVNFSDPSGLVPVWDAVDGANALVSFFHFIKCPGWGTLGVLALDGVGVLPFLPGLSTVRHAANLVDGVVDLRNGADNIADSAAGVANLAGGVRGGRAPEFFGGQVSESGFLNSALDYLGSGYKEVSPGRYVSSDGLRQLRLGDHEIRSPTFHGHFEAFDAPYGNGGRVVENTVVFITSD